jgi:beta-lactamase regulating signal transducer with metallopeptidase domain
MTLELEIVIKTTAVLVSAGLATTFLGRASAATRHAVWSIALLCLLVQPAVMLLLPQQAHVELPLLPESRNNGMQAAVDRGPANPVRITGTQDFPQPLVTPGANPARRSSRQWIGAVWAVGFMVVLAQIIAAAFAAHRLTRRLTPTSDYRWLELLAGLRRELSITQTVDLRVGGEMPPMAWGLFRPVILLPSSANEWTEARRRAVLAHELAHVNRRDGLTQILVQLACSVYWFNPLVWFAERRMRVERERACDDYVLNLGTRPASYADHLLELARGLPNGATLATVSMAHPSQLETRLRAILDPRLKRSKLSRGAAAFVVSSLATVMLFVGAIQITSLLSLALPVAKGPLVPTIQPEVGPPPVLQTTGTVTGQALWTDGAASPGLSISAIAITPPNPPDRDWLAGERVAASAVTDNAGRYRIENLAPGRYHFVSGPVYLPQFFSDVAAADSVHVVTVAAGGVVEKINFDIVRNPDTLPSIPGKVLTVTGKIAMKTFGSAGGGLFLLIPNSDGSTTRWHLRGRDRVPGGQRYWWPGYHQLRYEISPIAEMVRAGETVTISGTEPEDPAQLGVRNPALADSRVLNVTEATRGGR